MPMHPDKLIQSFGVWNRVYFYHLFHVMFNYHFMLALSNKFMRKVCVIFYFIFPIELAVINESAKDYS